MEQPARKLVKLEPVRKGKPLGSQPPGNWQASQADRLAKAERSYGSPSYGSVPLRVSDAEKEKVKALPDLIDKLKAQGIDSVYYEFRDSYLDWRKGGAAGTHGELTMQALEANLDPYRFEFWYPSPGVFKWRFTAAYWIAILFLQGSFFFTFDAGVQAFHGYGGHVMMTWPNLIGSVCFTVASYFIYLQLINIGADDEDDLHYFYADWSVILRRVGPSTCIGTMGYVLGALLFQVSVIPPLFLEKPDWAQSMSVWTGFIGSLGFVLGGICELVHNDIITFGTTPAEPVWWASMMNFLGAIGFALATGPPIFYPGWTGADATFFISLNMFIGSGLFALSSMLLIVMWEGNDFGLTLFYQLNRAIRAQAGVKTKILGAADSGQIGMQITTSASKLDNLEEHLELEHTKFGQLTKFDVRGTVFLVIYCWFVFVASVDCLCQDIRFNDGHGHIILLWTGIGMQVFVVSTVMIVLLIHSVVTHIPNEQPYCAAMMCGRCILVIGAVCQTLDLAAFLTKFGTHVVPH